MGNIRYARENMGNYFLKTASDYVVPAEQRLTVLRALDRITKLRLAVIEFIEFFFSEKVSFFQTYTYKMQFNKRVLDLIERKRRITEQINNELQRLQTVGQNLGINQELFNIPLLPTVEDGQEK